MRKQNRNIDPKQAFDDWYRAIWAERWDTLRDALMQPIQHVAWWNPFSSMNPEDIFPDGLVACPTLFDSYYRHLAFPSPEEFVSPLPYYLLDGASVIVAQCLQVQPTDHVLDLCAAPGGKSLQIAANLTDGKLTANEFSRQRRNRLLRVLQAYLPAKWLHSQIQVTGFDASRWCLYERKQYDRILLDAPCSSERHLLQSPAHLKDWTPARSLQLATRQYAMLASALEVVKIGGTIVYSTCAISPLENDGVLDKLHKKRPERFLCLRHPVPEAEMTPHGYQILPDRSPWGPIYFSILQRLC